MTDVHLLTELDEFKILGLLNLDTRYNGLILSDLKRSSNRLRAMYGCFTADDLAGCLFIFEDKIAYFGDESLGAFKN